MKTCKNLPKIEKNLLSSHIISILVLFPKEICIWVHGPFRTGVVFDAGISDLSLDELNQLSQNPESLNKDSYRQAIIDEAEMAYPVLINERRKQFELTQVSLPDSNIEKSELAASFRFEKSTVSFYAHGAAVFSSLVKITFDNDPSIENIKEVENELEKIIKLFFEKKVLEFRRSFYDIVHKHNFPIIKDMESDPSGEDSFAWLHKIYWFYGPQFFDGDGLKIDIYKQFCVLLDQKPDNMSPFLDRYIYYGEGRSIIVNKNDNTQAIMRETIKLLKVLEVSQYFCYGLYQLHDYLTEKTINLEIETDLEQLRRQIEELTNIRMVAFRYLEQFRHGFNILFQSGTRLLLEQVIKQWRLEQTEDSIRNELNFIANELGSMEQSLLTRRQERLADQQALLNQKQNYLNRLALCFTLITLVGVMANVVILSPLKTMFPESAKELLWSSQLFIVLVVAGALIIGAAVYYSHVIRKMSQSSAIKKVSQTVQQRARDISKRHVRSTAQFVSRSQKRPSTKSNNFNVR